jgi:hypothetical protein
MGLLDGLLQQLLKTVPGQENALAEQHFDQVAQQASPDLLSQGLAAAFRSDQTPAFPQMAAQMFARATPEQQQAILAHMQGVLGADAGSALGGQNVSPGVVQSTLERAHADNPSIIDKMSDFYAQHPGLVKTIGGAALTIAMAKMADHARQG